MSGFSDAKMRFSPKKGNAFLVSPGTLWNANWNAFGTQMERERSVRFLLSSTVIAIMPIEDALSLLVLKISKVMLRVVASFL